MLTAPGRKAPLRMPTNSSEDTSQKRRISIEFLMLKSRPYSTNSTEDLGKNSISVLLNSGSSLAFHNFALAGGLYSNEAKPFSRTITQWILDNCALTESGRLFLYGQRKLSREIIERLNIVSLENSRFLVERLSNTFDVNMLKKSGLVSETNGRMYFRMFTPCLLFPYYDKEGVLTGIQSRYLGSNKEVPRFQFVSAQKTRVFNMPIINSMKYGDELYISEGITDCLALLSAGKKAVALPSATILPLYDLMELSKFVLHMYPDQDDAGKKAYMALRRFFINHYAILKEEQLPNGFKDYSEYYVLNHGKE